MSNQLVLPGLGSLASGRRSGFAQAALASIGVTLTGFFAIWFFKAWINLDPAPETMEQWAPVLRAWKPHLAIGASGFGLFGAAWLWALASSVNILRESYEP